MDEQRHIKISKYLSKHLRHQPERLGITLESGGWVEVEDLLLACQKNRFPISREELNAVVRDSDKQRFAFDETGTKIRANQGHSVEVDLELEVQIPPAVLYHGTAESNLSSIMSNGLDKMRRHHVHLSVDRSTAIKVGSRHGKPIVLVVDAAKMAALHHQFYRSENGVWLTDHVPPEFLNLEQDIGQ